MRGKVTIAGYEVDVKGITPAYAGKRLCLSLSFAPLWDHPRVCGEKLCPAEPYYFFGGSPPRMRGKGQKGLIFVLQPRITPAYAGKRLLRQLRHITSRDHPRVCGEKVGPVGCVSGWLGSPPRMRGKVWHGVALADGHRITPAYAGKSCIYRSTTSISWDHPRVCGEKLDRMLHHRRMTGSPPRVRGKGAHKPVRLLDGGITPAYAGKSSRARLRCRCTWDHPRVCGEKNGLGTKICSSPGSPPRMRGKVPRNLTDYQTRRITPAYAGKRRALLFQARQYGDHPRVCGEKWVILQKYLAGQGSPPRMRGKGKYRQG